MTNDTDGRAKIATLDLDEFWALIESLKRAESESVEPLMSDAAYYQTAATLWAGAQALRLEQVIDELAVTLRGIEESFDEQPAISTDGIERYLSQIASAVEQAVRR